MSATYPREYGNDSVPDDKDVPALIPTDEEYEMGQGSNDPDGEPDQQVLLSES